MGHTISKNKFAVPGEAIEHQGKALIALHIAGTFEKFIEHGTQQIFIGLDKPRRGDLIWKLPVDQTVVICEVDIKLHIERRAGRGWSLAGCKSRRDGRCLGSCRCMRGSQ